MGRDKCGLGQDSYCYEGSDVLRNKLNITDGDDFDNAEEEITQISVEGINFCAPPYNLDYLCDIHRQLFGDLFDWAGELRTVDISKGTTRFCTCLRIKAEADKLFEALAANNFFVTYTREELVKAAAEFYIELNMVHPFREGNGRTQRILFEHIIINCGYEFSLSDVDEQEWTAANIAGVDCDYKPMEEIFEQCIGDQLGGDLELK